CEVITNERVMCRMAY
ncbi:hypothetical protein ACN38_g9621, partial [Penicillium nordicum]